MKLLGDSYEVLSKWEGPLFHSTVTSPPYFGKLDYQVEGQIGLETQVDQYIGNLGLIFQRVLDVTLPGGALLVNIGDTWNNYSSIRSRLQETKGSSSGSLRRGLQPGYQEKEALGVPWRLLESLRRMGWLHRDTFVWVKPTPGRPSKSDRPGSSHELIWYLRKPTKGHRYREAYWDGSHLPSTVLTVPVTSSPCHPCPFPEALVLPLVLATVPEGAWVLDPFSGSDTVLKVAESHDRESLAIDLKEY